MTNPTQTCFLFVSRNFRLLPLLLFLLLLTACGDSEPEVVEAAHADNAAASTTPDSAVTTESNETAEAEVTAATPEAGNNNEAESQVSQTAAAEAEASPATAEAEASPATAEAEASPAAAEAETSPAAAEAEASPATAEAQASPSEVSPAESGTSETSNSQSGESSEPVVQESAVQSLAMAEPETSGQSSDAVAPAAAEADEQTAEITTIEEAAASTPDQAADGAGWRAIQGDSECCGTGCAKACEAEPVSQSSNPAESGEDVAAPVAQVESMTGAGWRAIESDSECCGTGCAKACEPVTSAAAPGKADDTQAAGSAPADTTSEGAGWRAIEGDSECCGTGCATACAPDTSATSNGETETSAETPVSDAAGWRAIQGESTCCGTGCAKACQAAAGGEHATASDTGSDSAPAQDTGSGWRSIGADSECCGTGCAKACEPVNDTAKAATAAPAAQIPETPTEEGAGWRPIQGDSECCGTGCATACSDVSQPAQSLDDTSPQQNSAATAQISEAPASTTVDNTAAPAVTQTQQSLYTVQNNKVDSSTWVGSKIYQRVFGRGCGTCHDIQSNPNLTISLRDMSREEFAHIMRNGRNSGRMPRTIDSIMSLGPVKKAGLSEDQAIDAVYAYLKGRALGDIPAGRVGRLQN